MENLIKELFVYAFNILIGALIVMLSWNYVVPGLFNLDTLTYWESLVLLILTGTLFKTGIVTVSNIEENN